MISFPLSLSVLSAEQVTLRHNSANGPRPSSCWTRRTRLPAPRPSPGGPSLWNLLYKNIGKDLSQISMPVTINEPLNMLQVSPHLRLDTKNQRTRQRNHLTTVWLALWTLISWHIRCVSSCAFCYMNTSMVRSNIWLSECVCYFEHHISGKGISLIFGVRFAVLYRNKIRVKIICIN